MSSFQSGVIQSSSGRFREKEELILKQKKSSHILIVLLTSIVIVGAVGFLSFEIIQNHSRIERHTPPHDASLYDKWFRQIYLQKFLSNSIKAVNLQHCDLSELDLAGKFDILIRSDFDTKTIWPDRLPEPFDPVQIMENGKNPGL